MRIILIVTDGYTILSMGGIVLYMNCAMVLALLPVAVVWIKGWVHSDDCGAALSIDFVTVPLDRGFNRCTEKKPYVSGVRAIMVCYADLRVKELVTPSLNYGDLLRSSARHYLWMNFK